MKKRAALRRCRTVSGRCPPFVNWQVPRTWQKINPKVVECLILYNTRSFEDVEARRGRSLSF